MQQKKLYLPTTPTLPWKDIPLIMPKGVEGIRICCSGRLGGAEIARTECGKYGKTSFGSFNLFQLIQCIFLLSSWVLHQYRQIIVLISSHRSFVISNVPSSMLKINRQPNISFWRSGSQGNYRSPVLKKKVHPLHTQQGTSAPHLLLPVFIINPYKHLYFPLRV